MRKGFALFALLLASASAWAATEGGFHGSYVLPAVARTEGLYGSYWLTDVSLVNPYGWREVRVKIRFLETDKDNSSAPYVSVAIPRGGSLAIPDVLMTLFGKSGNGALFLSSEDGAYFAASSRTYTGAPGTYGLCENAQSRFSSGGERVFLPGLREGRGFRTNTGVASTSDQPVNLTLHVYSTHPTEVGTLSVTLKPWSHLQVPFSTVAPGCSYGYAVWTSATAGGSWMAYATVIDNISNDSVFVEDTPDDAAAAFQNSYDLSGWWQGTYTVSGEGHPTVLKVVQAGAKLKVSMFEDVGEGPLGVEVEGREHLGAIELSGPGTYMYCLNDWISMTGTVTPGGSLQLSSTGTGCFAPPGSGTFVRKPVSGGVR